MTILRGDNAPTCAPPDPNPKKPAITLPPLSCDAHFHVFGPRRVFRFADDRPYTPQDAPKEDLFRLHKRLGFERGVFVQSTTHGKDHSVVTDLIAAAQGRYRGVGLIDPSTPKAEVVRLHEAGICGARFHFVQHLGDAMPPDEIRAVVAMIAPLGWHVAAHVGPGGVLDHYDFLASLPTQVVIDHIGRSDVGEGPNGKAFAALKRLTDRGNVWVKLSGTDRITRQPYPYRDAVPLARALAEHAPERVVWGTDWPHPNHQAMPNDGALVDLIAEIAPSENARRLMLVENPARLFGFA
jgi:predicted TIM-barrel fold metal-dependent hydrolase